MGGLIIWLTWLKCAERQENFQSDWTDTMPQAKQTTSLNIAIAQVNMLVGDIEGNTRKIIEYAHRARQEMQADLIVFPELTLTGYPPEDLLFRNGLYRRIDKGLERIMQECKEITLVLGYPRRSGSELFNAAGVIQNGSLVTEYFKYELPNYSVFDEKRYFVAGQSTGIFHHEDIPIGLSICEDAWHPNIIKQTADAGAQIILNLNASPYHVHKTDERRKIIADRVLEAGVPVVYVNQVGGQDELVFDGASFVINAQTEVICSLGAFTEELALVEFVATDFGVQVNPSVMREYPGRIESVYQALVLGVRDYIEKNRFAGAVIGLSGGIDSALTLAIAVDAIGAERVHAIGMPSRYTADMSVEDACLEAETLGVQFDVLPIEPIFNEFLGTLEPMFEGKKADTTEENIQARIRGVLLMALSNKHHHIVLTTGNKSEVAVGYCTLYGDMVGGFSVLKDVPKTMVYELSRYRNTLGPAIPERVLTRPPSAELAPDQTDQDSLPPYDILDPILEMYIEKDLCMEDIVAAGYDQDTVARVIRLVNMNEYKRRQAAPGVKITKRAFGRDRRYPITSGFDQTLK
jgi:NAD+ synthase (glutamine-hydrolysing)